MFKSGLGDLLGQAQKMREEMQRIQETLAKRTVEASSGGGMIRVVANGKQQILSVTIDPQVLEMKDVAVLQDLVVAGVNQALQAAQQAASEEMGKLTAGLGPLAGLFKNGG